ncbi:anther-specific protein BCP1-like [Herrania umbratica]|uniref:Anther-specific protein BCP1-like n=1 Tax=Herrania umbratica TaxID=108875 RepID=A0A6J1B244_9ROSI|nr:anther-specific protein BCP1-like [Herrania umbratica]
MARQILVLALVFIALVGLVSAGQASSDSKGGAEAAAPVNDDTIGNTDEASAPTTGGDEAAAAVEGPVGSEDAAKNAAAALPPSSGATTLGVSAVAGAVAIAGYLVF